MQFCRSKQAAYRTGKRLFKHITFKQYNSAGQIAITTIDKLKNDLLFDDAECGSQI